MQKPFLALCLTAALLAPTATGSHDLSGLHRARPPAESAFWFGRKTVTLPLLEGERLVECLAVTAFAEARGEAERGIEAVLWTLVNRASTLERPDLCAVALEPKQFKALDDFAGLRTRLEDGSSRFFRPDEERAYRKLVRARVLAREILAGRRRDPTRGATFFATRQEVNSGEFAWLAPTRAVQTATIGGHVFFRKRGRSSL